MQHSDTKQASAERTAAILKFSSLYRQRKRAFLPYFSKSLEWYVLCCAYFLFIPLSEYVIFLSFSCCNTLKYEFLFFSFLQEMHVFSSLLFSLPIFADWKVQKKKGGHPSFPSLLHFFWIDSLFFFPPFSSDLTSQRKRGWIHNCLQLTCLGEVLCIFFCIVTPKQFEFNFTPVTSYENIEKCMNRIPACTDYRA